jgi:cephalosporin hydroxylase
VSTTDATALPVAEELKFAAITAVWDNQSWRTTTWLGVPVARYPTDLHAYQELMAGTRPEAVVLLGDDPGLGGRALFAASVLADLGTGIVIAVGVPGDGPRPTHERITYVDGNAEAPEVADEVTALVAGRPALVIAGLGSLQRLTAAFDRYAPLVPVDGYVVVENTVVNGRPAAAGFGPGPHEAVTNLLGKHPEFVPDVAFERFTLTFNKGGYLRRTAPTR